MKKLFAIFLSAFVLLSLAQLCFAEDDSSADVFAKFEDGERTEVPVSDERAETTLPDETDVIVEKIPENVSTLVIYSVPTSEKEAWDWVTSCFASEGTPVHTFDIYFADSDGKRSNADGAVVTIDCSHCEGVMTVCSLTTDGVIRVLGVADASADALSFTTDGSHYYVVMVRTPEPNGENRVIVNGNPGGDVEIDGKNPTTGDTVTVITKPDENMTVDQIIITDGDGNKIKVKDNGDGSYSFEQPAGDVTVNVTYKELPESEESSLLWLWVTIGTVSTAGIGTAIFFVLRKKKRAQQI